MALKVGDKILFDHHGVKDRPGVVTKITTKRVYIEWTAPSSGITHTVAFQLEHLEKYGRNIRILTADGYGLRRLLP